MKYMLTYNYLCDADSYEYIVVEAPRNDVETMLARAYEQHFGEWITQEEYDSVSDYNKDVYQYIPQVGMYVNAEDIWFEPVPPNMELGWTEDPATTRRARFSMDRKRRRHR